MADVSEQERHTGRHGRVTWASKAALFSSFLGKPSMRTCCLPPLCIASSSKLMVTCSHVCAR